MRGFLLENIFNFLYRMWFLGGCEQVAPHFVRSIWALFDVIAAFAQRDARGFWLIQAARKLFDSATYLWYNF